MNARTLQQADEGTPLEVIHPVLFNTFKHHIGALRARIGDIVDRGNGALVEMGTRLAVLGTRLMDLYTGALSPRELSTWVIAELTRIERISLDRYRDWMWQAESYTLFTHPVDNSRWVLRMGDERGRYVHLHPGRWSPCSVRVRANVLKTAFLVLCYTGIHGGNPRDRDVINEVRRLFLGLSPINDTPEDDVGLGAMIERLTNGGA
jgi:hypothetical protein